MPHEEDYIIIKDKKKSSNWMYLIFFGIIAFLMIYFPFFGGNMRYEFGVVFSQIFITLGILMIFLGIIFILNGILSFFFKSPLRGFKYLLMGIVMLTFAGYFLVPGSFGTVDGVPKGYH